MIKKVSAIIYHHILHSHKNIKKESQGAQLFSESVLSCNTETKEVYIMGGFQPISPTFTFHIQKETQTKERGPFNKYQVFEFISVIIGSMQLHLE